MKTILFFLYCWAFGLTSVRAQLFSRTESTYQLHLQYVSAGKSWLIQEGDAVWLETEQEGKLVFRHIKTIQPSGFYIRDQWVEISSVRYMRPAFSAKSWWNYILRRVKTQTIHLADLKLLSPLDRAWRLRVIPISPTSQIEGKSINQ